MTHAIQLHETGGPEVMKWEAVDVAAPGPGEALLRQTVVGAELHRHLSAQRRLSDRPARIHRDGSRQGVVEAVGEGVTNVKPGDRVGYVMGPAGAYAERRTYPASRLIALPDDIADEAAAAMMLKGLTAAYLTQRTFPVQAGQTVLFHAAAGGVGLIICQWLNMMGATVIGTVSREEKAAVAKAHGCHHTINYSSENFADSGERDHQRRWCPSCL